MVKKEENVIKEILKRGFIGLGCASLFCMILTLIEYWCGVDFSDLGVIDTVRNQIAYSLVGLALGCASVLFNMERFSMLKATVLHFIIILLVYVLAGFIGGWFCAWGVKLLIPVACFAGTYLITWTTVYFAIKKSADKINQKLGRK